MLDGSSSIGINTYKRRRIGNSPGEKGRKRKDKDRKSTHLENLGSSKSEEREFSDMDCQLQSRPGRGLEEEQWLGFSH